MGTENPTHVTASTKFVSSNGIRFAYRRFGNESGVPLLFMQHFRGGLDHWDPSVTDGFSHDRQVILFDNAGVAGSSGETPSTIDAMADDTRSFVDALGLAHFDLLGFSMGGYVAQAFAIGNSARPKRAAPSSKWHLSLKPTSLVARDDI